MKNFKVVVLFIIVFMFFLGIQVQAAPFLVCDLDPENNTVEYVIRSSTGEEIVTPYPLHYDLAGAPDGTYTIQVRARNEVGDSPGVDFIFTLPIEEPQKLPGSPVNVRIE